MLPFSETLGLLRKSASTLTIALSAGLLAACGGGGGSAAPSPAPPPPPPPAPSGISFDLDGTATKGLILGGAVRVVDANDSSVEIATGTTSTTDGSFDLSISGTSGSFKGGVVKVIVNGGIDVVMVCDAPAGCYGTAFGGTVAISNEFELSALVETPADGQRLTVHVSAITTLAAELAEFNANGSVIDTTDIVAANSQVAGLFGFDSADLLSLPGIDLTVAGSGNEPSADALRAAFINAGILEAMLEGSGTLDQRLSALVTDFTENGGQLIINEATDDSAVISLEDIIVSAVNTTVGSPLNGGNRDAASSRLETDFLAIVAAPHSTRTAVLPERPVLSVSGGQLSFSGIAGKNVSGVALSITGEGVPWRIRSDQTWIEFDQISGTGDTTIMVYPVSSRASLGLNEGSFTVYDTEAPKEITLNVDFTVGDVLALSTDKTPDFKTVNGATTLITKHVSLSGQNISWDYSSDQSWVSITPVTGTSPENLSISVDPTGVPTGKHTAYITISDTNFDQRVTLQTDIFVEPRLINVEETGVSFSHFPTKSILAREIMVSENLGQPLTWSASSNAAWLTVTETGQTEGILSLQADPTGLTSGQLYSAQVQLGADDAAVENIENINVTLWVGDTDPVARLEVNIPTKNIVTDPVRPYLYVNRGDDTDVEIFNVYTGQSVGLIADVTPANGVMAVSPDGGTLYVYDKTNRKIVPVNLSTLVVQSGWNSVILDSMVVNRINGKGVLFTGADKAYDAETGAEIVSGYGVYNYNGYNSVTVSKNGEIMCVMDRGLSPFSLYCFGISYSHLEGGNLSLAYHGDVRHGVGSNGGDAALSDDGTLAYTASGSPYQFNVFDSTTMAQVQTLGGSNYPNAAEMGPNGIFYGGINGYYATTDVWAYDQAGNLVSSYDVAGSNDRLLPRQLVISGDGSRLIGSTDKGSMVFLSTD